MLYAVSPGEPLPGGASTRWAGGVTAAAFTMLIYGFIVGSKWFLKTFATVIANLPWDPAGGQEMKRTAAQTQLERSLATATNMWLLPVVIRRYRNGADGDRLFEKEAAILVGHGYEPALQTEDGGHVHAGRLILTGGLSIFAGSSGIRSKGSLAVTFRKAAPIAT